MRQLSETLVNYLPVLLVLLTINVYVIWRRYRSRRELVRRVAELEDLNSAGRLLVAAQLDFDQLCELIVREAQAIIANETIQLGFFDGDLYHIQVLQVGANRLPPMTLDLSDGRGLVSWVRDQKKTLLVRDFEREKENLPAEPIHIRIDPQENNPPPSGGSAVLIPLIRGNKTIGILAAHHELSNQFSEHQERRLSILANQAAAALSNARLFAAERQRTAQVELLGEITRKINAIEDVDQLFGQVVTLTQQTFGYFQVNIYGVYEPLDEVILLASSDERLHFASARFAVGDGVIGQVLSHGQTELINQVREDPRFLWEVNNRAVTEIWQEVEAALVIPLEDDGDHFGVLELLHNEVDAFSPADQDLLESLAASISLAIQKAKQLARQLEQSWLTAARLQVSNVISSAKDLDDLLDKIACLPSLLSGVEQYGTLIWEEELQAYRPGYTYGLRPGEVARFSRQPWRLGDWPAVDAVHVGRETYQSCKLAPWQQSGAGLNPPFLRLFPLLAETRLLGIMFTSEIEHLPIRSSRMMLDNPDGRRVDLLRDMAKQLAMAVERQKLLTAQAEEAWVNTALLQVSEAVNSLIDLNDILNTIARLVTLLVGVESCVILVLDDEAHLFRPVASFGLSPMGQGMLATWELTMDEALQMAVTPKSPSGGPLTGQEHYRLDLPRWLKQTLLASDGYAVPLRSQGRLVGWLMSGIEANRQSIQPMFTGRRLNILIGIAHQAATAVTNHQLYQEAAERDRLEQELVVAHRLQSSLLPDVAPSLANCQIAHHWQAARQVGGDFYDFIPLKDGSWGIAVADVADKGFPAAFYMAVARTILRAVASSRLDPAEILERTNILLINNTGYDQFVSIFLGIWDAQTRQLRYACGGHNPAIHLNADGKMSELQAPGMILGVFHEAEFVTHEVSFAPGDVVLFFTDGVSEATNGNFDEFGVERLVLSAAESRSSHPSVIVSEVLGAIKDFVGTTPQSDDLTLVVMKVY
ncbi:MAG: SpoIIE family protein phosphatase [Ardenticatenaceae bacterium]|nr:SpoIIE family protein phosphatase [Ardenticatenaceae bacterium]